MQHLLSIGLQLYEPSHVQVYEPLVLHSWCCIPPSLPATANTAEPSLEPNSHTSIQERF